VAVAVVAVFAWRNFNSAHQAKQDYSIVAKIIWSGFQFNSIATKLNFRWVSLLQAVVASQQHVSDMGTASISFDCVLGAASLSPFYVKSLVFFISPLTVVPLLVCAFLLRPAWRLHRQGHNWQQKFRLWFTSAMTVVMFLFQPTLTRQAFEMWNCRNLGSDGEDYLLYDMTENCWTKYHYRWLFAVSIPMILLYAVGLPSFAGLLLRRNAQNLDRLEWLQNFGFLYSGYKKRLCFWESFTFIRKVSLVGISVFSVENSQMQGLMALLVVTLSLIFQQHFKPYVNPRHNRLEFYTLTISFFTFFVGQANFAEEASTHLVDFLNVLCIMANVLFFALSLAYLARVLWFSSTRAVLERLVRKGIDNTQSRLASIKLLDLNAQQGETSAPQDLPEIEGSQSYEQEPEEMDM
jgi:hypothetical protein